MVSKMVTYVYIGSVGPFENVYINKKNVNFSLFHFSTFTQSFVEDLKVAFEISTSI